jgi:hypothetical protein
MRICSISKCILFRIKSDKYSLFFKNYLHVYVLTDGRHFVDQLDIVHEQFRSHILQYVFSLIDHIDDKSMHQLMRQILDQYMESRNNNYQ